MYVPFYQCFIYNRMLICGQLLLLRAIVQHHVDFMEENWSKYKKSISQVLLGLKSHLKWENSLQLKLVLTGNLLLLHWISLDYFYHRQIFVHMCADRNFFLSKPTMHEIYSSRLKF